MIFLVLVDGRWCSRSGVGRLFGISEGAVVTLRGVLIFSAFCSV